MNLITVSPLEKSILPLIKRGLLSGLPPREYSPSFYTNVRLTIIGITIKKNIIGTRKLFTTYTTAADLFEGLSLSFELVLDMSQN